MSEMMQHDPYAGLAVSKASFDALAQVAGNEMARALKPAFIPGIAMGFAAGGATLEARFGTKGKVFNAIVGGLSWLVAGLAKENADLRNGAIAVASGLGSTAVAIEMYDWQMAKVASTSAPAPVVA